MKTTKRVVCLLLGVLLLLELLAGCAAKAPTDEEVYLSKGEFFALFVHEKNLTSENYSAEDIQNCQDGSVEANIISEWELLPEDMATEGLSKPVTKEIVVMVCANFAIGLSEGNTSDIKDSNLLRDPQLIADAYASGFFELENGYFDGQKKMSYADCVDVIEKSDHCTADFRFDEDEGEVEIADDVIVVDAEDLLAAGVTFEWSENTEETDEASKENLQEANGASFAWPVDEKPQASFLNNVNNTLKPELIQTANTGMMGRDGYVCAQVPEQVFVKKFDFAQPGAFVHINGADNISPFKTYDSSALYKVDSVQKIGSSYQCKLVAPTFEEAVEKENIRRESNSLNTADVKLLEKKVGDWEFSISTANNGVEVAAKGKVRLKSPNQTGKNGEQMADWRIATETINVETSFSISDFNIQADNLRSFVKKRGGEGFVKVTYDTAVHFGLSEEMKFAPDSNRNGGFLSNLKNSRLTDKSGPGAKSIKVAKIPIQAGPVSGVIDVYVNIGVDGTLTWESNVNDGGFVLRAKDRNISFSTIKGEKEKELNAVLNLQATLGADVQVYILGIVKVIDYDIGVVFELNFELAVYTETTAKEEDAAANSQKLNTSGEFQENDMVCIDLGFKIYPKGTLNDCAIKLVNEKLKLGLNLNFNSKNNPWISMSWHFEENGLVDKCTRGGEKEGKVQTTSDDTIELNTYKVIMPNGTCTTVELSKLPASCKDFLNTTNAVTVESLNEDVVKARYVKKGKYIILEANGSGSTEIIIKAKKGILWWKETINQSVSVTVNETQTV